MARLCKDCKHNDVDITLNPCKNCIEAFSKDQTKPAFMEKESYKVDDAVAHPSHYTQGGIECIDAIRSMLTPEEFRGFCKGNVIKYTWREKYKGNDESLKKAVWYLKQMVGE